jgi:hypothetical protein
MPPLPVAFDPPVPVTAPPLPVDPPLAEAPPAPPDPVPPEPPPPQPARQAVNAAAVTAIATVPCQKITRIGVLLLKTSLDRVRTQAAYRRSSTEGPEPL